MLSTRLIGLFFSIPIIFLTVKPSYEWSLFDYLVKEQNHNLKFYYVAVFLLILINADNIVLLPWQSSPYCIRTSGYPNNLAHTVSSRCLPMKCNWSNIHSIAFVWTYWCQSLHWVSLSHRRPCISTYRMQLFSVLMQLRWIASYSM